MPNLLVTILLVSGAVLRFAHARECIAFTYLRHLNKRLGYGIFKTLESSPIECQEECARTASCFSINTYKNKNDTTTCELVKETKDSVGWTALAFKDGGEHNELETITSCADHSLQCSPAKKGILPGHWYVHDSSAFKLFKEFNNHTKANDICNAHGGQLATISDENINKFISEIFLPKITKDPTPVIQGLQPLKHWKLDGSDSDVVTYGSAVFQKGPGDSTPALYLPGTSGSYATTPAVDIKDTSMTMALWMKMASIPSGQHYMYSYWSNPHIFAFYVYNAGGKGVFRVEARADGEPGNNAFFSGGGSLTVNVWTHVAFTLDKKASKAFFFQDGVEVSWGTSTNAALPSPVRSVFDIGLKRDTSQVMTGWMKDLIVFNRALSVGEIKSIVDAASLKFNVWIGDPGSYTNFSPDPQPSTNCVSMKGWGTKQWEKAKCTNKMEFVCKKPV